MPKTLDDLEWPRLLEHLAGRCSGEEAAERCRSLSFLAEEEARTHSDLVVEISRRLDEDDPPPSLPARPVGEWLDRIRSEGTVPPKALLDAAANLKLFVALARYVDNRRDLCPGNAARALPPERSGAPLSLARLAGEIESSLEPDGSVSSAASPRLGDLRRRVTSLRESLLDKLAEIAESEADLLQDRTFPMRNDRFVLPVRADAHRRLSGIVHGASGSGATVFVEPEAAVSLGNDLTLAREEVAREEARVVAELVGAVSDSLDDVRWACEALIDTETRIAAARLSRDLDAAVPQRREPGLVDLVEARHPLMVLDGARPVPIDVTVRPGEALVVSGPNAGGKTVLLKTVGLAGLMLAAGLPVPVDPRSGLGIPTRVLASIGDSQSLELSLSTFSAQMSSVASILESAGAGCLVLLDELAAGTDPDEGAALAEAVLERLNELGATTLATTHFDALKARAQSRQGLANASMGFDEAAMRPTFELCAGVPGRSDALSAAGRYGIPEDVLERARALLPEGARELADAVAALERRRREAALERAALAEQRKVLEAETRRTRQETARLRARQEKLLDEEAATLWSAIRRAREKVRDAESSLRRRRADPEAVRAVRRAVEEVAARAAPGGELSRDRGIAAPGRPARPDEIAPGARVWAPTIAAEAVVDAPPKGGKVFVRTGHVRVRVSLDGLRIPSDPPPRDARAGAPPSALSGEPVPAAEPVRTSEGTLDLRGMTVDEAISATDGFLDAALRDGADAVFLIHGHGTGALRDAVREHLAGSRYVERFRPGEREEGGDGVTVAWLR